MSIIIPVNVSFASPYLHENQNFLFNACVYQVDKQVMRKAKELFRHILTNHISSRKQLLPKLVAPVLSPETLKHILSFFQSGQFKNNPFNRIEFLNLNLISRSYQLSLLNRCLQATSMSQSLVDVEETLPLQDQLELAALQQNPKKFYTIFSCLDMQNDVEKAIFSLAAHFQPAAFETLMVNFIRPNFFRFSQIFMKTYFKKRQKSLADDLYVFKDKHLKFNCMAALSHLDKRLQWFQIFWSEIPLDLIRKVIIKPLMQHQCLLEAKEWVIKTKDDVSAQLLMQEFLKQNQEEEAKSLRFLIPSKESDSSKEATGEHFAADLFVSLGTLSIKEIFSSPLQIIRREIAQYVRMKAQRGSTCDKSLIETIGVKLNDSFSMKWNAKLLRIALRYFIQFSVHQFNQDTIKNLQCANIPLKPHEEYLHPALQEDYEVLHNFCPTLEEALRIEFKSNNVYLLLGKDQRLLKGSNLFYEILAMARYLYSQAFSLQEDFIVQFVSHELQPYVIKQRDGTFPQPSEPLIQRLETSFKDIGMGNELSSSQIELAVFIYVQKGVEAFNFRHFFPHGDKIDIYKERMSLIALLKIIENLQSALIRDFPLDKIQARAPKVLKLLQSKAELTREVFIKALKAYYYVNPYTKVKYKPYIVPKELLNKN